MKKSRIIYLVGAYPQWSETFVRQDLAMLLDLGLSLCPVALSPGDVECQPDWPEVTYLQAASTGREPAPPGMAASMANLLPRELKTRISLYRHRHLVRALAKLARAVGAEHIHAEFADLPALIAAATARQLRLGYSVSVHARDVHMAKFSPGLVYGRARFVVACNQAARDGVIHHSRGAKQGVHLVPHGLDFSCWHYQESPMPAEPEPLRLIYVGRFVEKKGLSVLFRALARLRETGLDVRLSLFGEGAARTALRSMGKTLGLEDVVSWRGVVSRTEVAEQMRQHHLLVMPSIVSHEGDRDGIPNVVLEAMACGTPVLGSDAGSLSDVLNVETGWISPAGDDGALAEAVQRLRVVPDQVRQRCRAARQIGGAGFDARVLVRKRAALLQSVLS